METTIRAGKKLICRTIGQLKSRKFDLKMTIIFHLIDKLT